MARPKKVKVDEVEATETTKEVVETTEKPTKVITRKLEVKDEPPVDEFVREPKDRLQQATTYKIYLGGEEQWLTRPQINISLQRGFNIVIPEGSPFSSDVERCTTCG
jgi:hypothetical protein